MEESSTSSKEKATWFELDQNRNTHVYVNGLPETITEAEFVQLMKKYGIISKKNGNFNVKLYKNKDGKFKGDATCCYARKESVDLAILHLDGYDYEGNQLHCERAKFEMKGKYDPSKKPKKTQIDKKKQKKKIDNLLSWEPEKVIEPKRVILKNMFEPDDIKKDPTEILQLKEDVEDCCNNLGCVPKRVDVHESAGVIEVTFAEPDEAAKCLDALDNRWYAKRLVKAEYWDGKTKYKTRETDEDVEKRLEKWHEDISGGKS